MKKGIILLGIILGSIGLFAQPLDYSMVAPFSHQSNSSGNNRQVTISYDTDADGAFNRMIVMVYDTADNLLKESEILYDGSIRHIRTYEYDSLNNVISEYYDLKGDGTINSWKEYTYDVNSNKLRETAYIDSSGVFLRMDVDVYDANSNIISHSVYYNGDTTTPPMNTYAYNADGNLTIYTQDSDQDGVTDRVDSYTYDVNGDLHSISYDYDADGNNDLVRVVSPSGQLLNIYEDGDDDGNVDHIEEYTYDTNDNKLTYLRDRDNDGIYDIYTTYQYDQNNNMISRLSDHVSYIVRTDFTYDPNGNMLTEYQDTGNDSIYDRLQTWTYDQNGNLLSYVNDQDADSIQVSTETFTYNSDNKVLIHTIDDETDGIYELYESKTYDQDGRLATIEQEINGNLILIRSYTYDQNGNLIEVRKDINGSLTLIRSYTYDATDRILVKSIDDDEDGVIDRIESYTYGTEGDNCPTLGSIQDKVYATTIPYDGDWKFSLCGSSFNTSLFIGSSICSDDIGYNNDACGTSSELVVTGIASGRYYVTVSGNTDTDMGDYRLEVTDVTVIDTSQTVDTTTVSVDPLQSSEGVFNIGPNPFTSNIDLTVNLDHSEHVRVSYYDITGKLCRVLHDGIMGQGSNVLNWDAKNEAGDPVRAGYYICHIKIGKNVFTRSLTKLN